MKTTRFLSLAALSLSTVPPSPAQVPPQGCAPSPAGLVAWWQAEGDAQDAAGSHHGALQNGAAFAPGQVGQAFNLDGVNDYVDVPHSAELNPSGAFSVEVWIQATPVQPESYFLIMDKSHGWTDSTGWVLQGGPGGLVGFGFGNGTAFPEVVTSSSVLDDQWHHLAGVFTGSQLDIYLDGVLQNTTPTVATPAGNNRDVIIGRSWAEDPSGSAGVRHFRGLIDEPSYYDRALTAAEIHQIHAASTDGKCPAACPVPFITRQPISQTVCPGGTAMLVVEAGGAEPLTFQWSKDGTDLPGETSATLVLDPIMASHEGTYAVRVGNACGFLDSVPALFHVAVSAAPNPIGAIAWWKGDSTADDAVGSHHGTLRNGAGFAPGRVGPAFTLDGVNDYVEVPDAPDLNFGPNTPMSFDLWAYRTGGPSVQHLFGKRGSGEANYQLAFSPNGGIGWGVAGSGFTLPNNTWTHLAGTFDGSTYRLYVNGQLTGSGSGTMGPLTSQPLILGGSGAYQTFAGLLDELTFYDRALAESEVQAIYTAAADGKCDTACYGPLIAVQPVSQNVCAGAAVTLSVSAAGTGLLSYEWDFGGEGIAGATGPTLTIDSASPADAGATPSESRARAASWSAPPPSSPCKGNRRSSL